MVATLIIVFREMLEAGCSDAYAYNHRCDYSLSHVHHKGTD